MEEDAPAEVDPPARADAATVLAGLLAHGDAEREPELPRADAVRDAEVPAEVRPTANTGTAAEEGGEPARIGRTARLWIALGVSVGFVVVGAGVLWARVSDPGYYMGRLGTPTEQALMQFTLSLMPGVVQAGVAGVVVVLVVWAVQARRSGGAER